MPWRAALVLPFLLAAQSAAAQRTPPAPWRVIHTGDHAVASLDTTRVVRRGTAYEVWLRVDSRPPTRYPTSREIGTTGWTSSSG
jgi:hypothetical protein